MLDDSASFLDDLESELSDEPLESDPVPAPARRRTARRASGRRIFGMSAPQRMVIAGMLFMMVCILAAFFLLITDSITF